MTDIPDKLFFKIGEVADLLDLKTHVLRYWETEFDSLKPVKSRSNQRLYRRQDVETALLIKDLLYRQGFTIAGARQQLKSGAPAPPPSEETLPAAQRLVHLKADLLRLRAFLTDDEL
ncbi:MAG: MerR family transcriptional regulator [Pelovirga sp.]